MRCPTLNELPSPPKEKAGWPWRKACPRLPVTLPDGRAWPRISVVTPSYNQGRFLEETIRSVLLQGYPHIEYIIIDGGSTDGSVDIIKKYEPWLTHWVSEHDGGQADAINKGFGQSGGEILAWLNSDDQYSEKALLSAVGFFRENPELDLIYGDCEMIDAGGRIIDSIEGRAGGLSDLLARDFIPQPSAFFRRRAWDAVGGLDPSLRFMLDYDLWIRMMLEGIQALYVPGPWSRFRWHEVSKSSRDVVEFGYEYLGILDRLFQGSYDPGLQRARLKGYHHAFSIIASGNDRLRRKGELREEDVVTALDRWETHLKQCKSEYGRAPDVWADSLYRIGQSYCLHGHRKEGRRAFLAALQVRKSEYRAFLGWVSASLGSGVYRWFTSVWRTLFNLAHHLRRRVHRKRSGY